MTEDRVYTKPTQRKFDDAQVAARLERRKRNKARRRINKLVRRKLPHGRVRGSQ